MGQLIDPDVILAAYASGAIPLPPGFVRIVVAGPEDSQRQLIRFGLREYPDTPAKTAAILREVADALVAPTQPDPDLV